MELKIVNYQYPDILNQEFDSNWLNIFIDVKSKMGHWQTVDPSLMTNEVQLLIDWFRDLSINKTNDDFGYCTEPNLSFNLLEKTLARKKIRIGFGAESRPLSFKPDMEYYIDCEFTNTELDAIASELAEELEKFPPR